VGTKYHGEISTRNIFDATIAKGEIEIIKNELNCNSIRISGDDVPRLILACEIALELGMTVWLSPILINHSQENTIKFIIQCAQETERLREKHETIIFVVGCEFSIFVQGIVPGHSIDERIRKLFSPLNIVKNILRLDRKTQKNLAAFMNKTVEQTKLHFKGKLSYASGTWERIDWTAFDIVGIDHYRASYNKTRYRNQLVGYRKYKKPIAVLEFGCCTYKGAEDKGGSGWAIVNWSGEKPEITGDYIRDENVQAEYIVDILGILDRENVLGAFVFTFVNPLYVHHKNPKFDLDMASYGIVTPSCDPEGSNYKGLPWNPKKAFFEIAKFYYEH
jgi:hypothetical protein